MWYRLAPLVVLAAATAGAGPANADGGAVADPASIVRFSVVDTANKHAPIPSGTAAPPIEGARSVDGALLVLSASSSSSITVVNVWASWCGPCVRELPMLADAHQRYRGRVRILGLADDDAASVQRLLARVAVPYQVALIPSATARAWNVTALPTTFIVDEHGIVRWSITGAIDADTLDSALAPLLSAEVKGGDSATRPLELGETVLGTGFALRDDGVVAMPHELLHATDALVATASDGTRLSLLGAFAHEESAQVAFVKVDRALPALTLNPQPAELDEDAARALPLGSPIVDAAGKVVAMRGQGALVPAPVVAAAMGATRFDQSPVPLGPNVRRNLLISAAVFAGLVASFFCVPIIARWVTMLLRRRQGATKWTRPHR